MDFSKLKQTELQLMEVAVLIIIIIRFNKGALALSNTGWQMNVLPEAWLPYIPHDVWTPMNTNNYSLRNKRMRVRNNVAHVEHLRGLARPVLRYAVTVIYRNQQRKKQKRFFVFRKKEQS